MLQFDILYFKDCPNYVDACDVICEVVGAQNLHADISIIPITEDSNLKEMKFRGSPTILLNGIDVEECYSKEVNTTEVANLSCRIYNCQHGRGCPSREMLACAINDLMTPRE